MSDRLERSQAVIDPRYVQTMARYNSWQNNQSMPVLEAMSHDELTKDHGAFFGSLLATANHLLWGDILWMSRFDPSVQPPEVGGADSTGLHPTVMSWAADRFRLDGKIRFWADGLRAVDLIGDLTWYSGTEGRDMTTPISTAVIHFFNHQTHHRGQIHAMLTASGRKAPVSDLVFMPQDI
ncbi:DinB family protein [Roseobacter sp. OBYS 0001]|uniref:DinB family protein n=1 Tax=Roseobacter sp. OBYS 0001 TaxID=882651 RepID=UPI001C826743|nr:DinB family protein [Roseobacter sp. OBYS 0001]